MPRRDLVRFNLLPQVDNEQEVKATAQLLFAETLKLCFNRHVEVLENFQRIIGSMHLRKIFAQSLTGHLAN